MGDFDNRQCVNHYDYMSHATSINIWSAAAGAVNIKKLSPVLCERIQLQYSVLDSHIRQTESAETELKIQ